jgi:hypothetical protein
MYTLYKKELRENNNFSSSSLSQKFNNMVRAYLIQLPQNLIPVKANKYQFSETVLTRSIPFNQYQFSETVLIRSIPFNQHRIFFEKPRKSFTNKIQKWLKKSTN